MIQILFLYSNKVINFTKIYLCYIKIREEKSFYMRRFTNKSYKTVGIDENFNYSFFYLLL